MSVANLQTLDTIRAQLKREKNLEEHVKSDLYSHLTEVFTRIMQNHPYDGFDKFEEISQLVKNTNMKVSDPKFDYELNQSGNQITNKQALEYIEKAKKLLREHTEVSILDKGLLSKDQRYIMPNINDEAAMFEWAGICFGSDQVFMLQKSLKRLALLSGASPIRFFGKIFGREKDYWVAKGQLNYSEEQPRNQQQEKRGTGANTYVYWVTDNLLNDWIQLPDVQPEHIIVSRMLKYVFTGNLNATINSCPPFPGKERHLLRA
jgi:hypothetical protein